MRYCPDCGERFDEDIIKFCTKDGTPLVEEDQPKFTAMPSHSADDEGDIGEDTVIRRKPFDGATSPESTPEPERFVISTSEPPPQQQVRPRPTQAYYPPAPPSQNTGKVVILTILGTIFVLACGAMLFWLLQKDTPANANANNINTNMPNMNLNLNTSTGFDSNFNFNAVNTNTNFSLPNLNMNVRATPSPKASPSPRPSPISSPLPIASPRPPVNTPPSSTPRTGPRPPGFGNRPTNGN